MALRIPDRPRAINPLDLSPPTAILQAEGDTMHDTNWLDAEADALLAEIPVVVESVIARADQEREKGNIEKSTKLLGLAAYLEAEARNVANLDAFRRQVQSQDPPVDDRFSRN